MREPNSFARPARGEPREPSGPDGHPYPGEPSSPITAVGPKSFAGVRCVVPATARGRLRPGLRKPRVSLRFRRPSADSRGVGVRVTRTRRLMPPWRTHPFPLGLAPSWRFDPRSSDDMTTTGRAPQGQDVVELSTQPGAAAHTPRTRHRSQGRRGRRRSGILMPARFSCARRRWGIAAGAVDLR
jgi:hypothetical protein